MPDWWRGAVIYQIYPRSYRDANGDGVGDLKGITEKLDYVALLGVEAIWLSPFFKSPMKDYGYDVTDYCEIDPLFGSLSDFKELLNKAHHLGLKIIVDMVISHTSDQHPWFEESRRSRDNSKSDWYVWADPKPDGSPPNNWQAHFGGSSWTYEVRRGQYYLHNFLAEQPDLNLYDPELRKALVEIMRFWLDMGVDGFRLDAVQCYFHSPGLEDNPPNPNPATFSAIMFPTPHSMQTHIYDSLVEPGVEFCMELRHLLDEYNDRMVVAEVGGEEDIVRAIRYTNGPKLLHTSYNFGLLSFMRPSASYIMQAVTAFESRCEQAWPSWAFSNHDVARVASRWHPDKNGFHHDLCLSKMLIALLCGLRGSIFLYQGEELGLPEAEIPFERIQDPYGKYLYPQWYGRDGCRTPMPWESTSKNAGFGGDESWLPVPASHLPLAVDVQEKEEDSVLNFTRGFLKWRKTQLVLVNGEIAFIENDNDSLLGFAREEDGRKVLCLFNLVDYEQSFSLPIGVDNHLEFGTGTIDTCPDGKLKVNLLPYGFYFGVSA